MKKKSILLVVLLITIGFAAVSTTLIMNGAINITSNKEDFDVYFSEAILDNVDVSDTIISSDKKTINFSTKNLKNVGDTSVLEYEVTNNSTQYDASVQVNCTPNSGDYFNLKNSLKETIVAKTRENGKVTVELTKASINEQNINFTCTIDVIATEKTEANNGPIAGTCEYENGTEWKYEYTGDSQEFVTPCEGEYKIELWGAQGGDSNLGGKGAYTQGMIGFEKDKKIFIYVGEMPRNQTYVYGGYNGGGDDITGTVPTLKRGAGGGGATDIRLVGGIWNDFTSLKSRIMVAAGGGGTGSAFILGAGAGGELKGVNGQGNAAFCGTIGGSQTAPGKYSCVDIGIASFGKGGTASSTKAFKSSGGGGGGYYGGGGGEACEYYDFQETASGAGGSSFISGHLGCDAIAENSAISNIIHTGQPNHYSGYNFNNTKMIAGTEVMPSHDGLSTMTGNAGNGFVKITYRG